MAHLEALQTEHQAIRRVLLAFQEVLRNSQPSQSAQDIHRQLVELLEAHLRNEEQAMAPYGNRIQAVLKVEAFQDRVEPRVVLRDLQVLFAAWRQIPTGILTIHLSRLIEELKECFDQEEHETFPVMRYAEEDARQAWLPVGSSEW